VIDTFFILLTGFMAFAFGRSFLIWSALTYVVGWPMLIVLFLFGGKPKTWERRGEMLHTFADKLDKWDKKNKPEGYQDFETVDDLFKQLETKQG
jgi:hypothetical protein